MVPSCDQNPEKLTPIKFARIHVERMGDLWNPKKPKQPNRSSRPGNSEKCTVGFFVHDQHAWISARIFGVGIKGRVAGEGTRVVGGFGKYNITICALILTLDNTYLNSRWYQLQE